ncbi:efflux RND transporter periplasmic adaptor subunit [Fodinibius salsisoli]|uniref:Efflux RND transporter periplasmic adaptor subunit n=1 Tax=Fodinibius salsisoli TaxID=2820877 RepID=A0ABT3PL59_9BACT|nr:efflux RND transporter periplasmic adaptor subunit [Fodinibius salsisoli]MCW9706685.1 efflux RND transporter periplasmic adaptor subunit [Fodinibius salsisoli]
MKKLIILLNFITLIATGPLLTRCSSNSSSNNNNENHTKKPSQHRGEHAEDEEQHAKSSETEGHSGESEHQAREVHLSKQQRNNLGIKVDTLNSGSASSTIARPASITYDLDEIAKVGPRIEAKVIRVLKDLGDNVQQGERLVLMSSVELGKVKADYIRLRAALKREQAHYKREKSLFEQDISSQAELLKAEAEYEQTRAERDAAAEALRLYGLSNEAIQSIEAGTEAPLSHFYITSPINGVVQERNLSPGQTVSSSETPIHIANLSKMWVMIDAYEQDIRYLEQGQSISLSVRSLPSATFKGTIDWISYALQKDSRTMPVRAHLENTGGQLRSGMFGTVRIQTDTERKIAMIPVDAVQTIEGESMVFVPGQEPGSFRATKVMLSTENEGMVEIASGLQPGDRAVIAGAFDLKSALTAQSRSASHSH